MYESAQLRWRNNPQFTSDFRDNKKVEAISLELMKLEKIEGANPLSYVTKIFGDESVKDMIVAGILPNVFA